MKAERRKPGEHVFMMLVQASGTRELSGAESRQLAPVSGCPLVRPVQSTLFLNFMGTFLNAPTNAGLRPCVEAGVSFYWSGTVKSGTWRVIETRK